MVTSFTLPKPAERGLWLQARHGFFNASDAACLYSAHPHRDLADVVADKMAPEPVDNGQTEAMERGDRLEPVLLEWFGDRQGVKVVTPDVLHVNGRLMATLDGEVVGNDDAWVEAKTTMDRWDEVPSHVYWQMVAQAAASGRREGWCVWFDADLRLKFAKVTPAPEHIADVLAKAEQFMAFIDMGMTPEDVELSAEHVALMFPAPEVGKWVELDEAGRDAVVRWNDLRLERIAVEKLEALAKDEVANLLTDAEGAKFAGLPVVTWRRNKSTERFSVRAHAAEAPDCHAAFTAEAPGPRVLRATKELRTFGGER